ncbi:MAG: redoxin domain-containing protein [Bacilli bacterium]|nr:redoxin domain-containing protein [Bacilli bacterium]
MKKWIIILVLVGMLGWAVYDFVIDDNSKDTAQGFSADENTESEKTFGLEEGDMAPDFELQTLDGETVKLSDFRGEKVLLNFWATWCPPCRSEMPDMQKFHEEYDATILAVNLTETEASKENVQAFLDEYGVTFTVLTDEDSEIATLYNASALPTSYLINSKGEVHNIAIGPLNYDMMVQAFEEME